MQRTVWKYSWTEYLGKPSRVNDRAAEYLLDDRYMSSLTAEDSELHAALLQLAADTSPDVKSKSPGCKRN
jgi:hypothetical protein